MLSYSKPGKEIIISPEKSQNKWQKKKNDIVSNISDKVLWTLLNSEFVREKIQWITEKKNELSSERSRENLYKLMSDEIKWLKCWTHFRIYKKDKENDTIVLDLTRNLWDFQVISKKKVLELLIDEVAEIVADLKSNRDVLGDFHKLALTSWIFWQRNKYGLRENITNKLAKSIPELDQVNSKLMKMTLVDKIGTMWVYPHDFLNILHHKSKWKLVIDLDKKVVAKEKVDENPEKELPLAV